VHTKLVCAFFVVAFLFIGTAAMSLQTVRGVADQSRRLDALHERVELSWQIQQALSMQMNFTVIALSLRSEDAIERILRENNRFNNKLAQIEEAATLVERELIEKIRLAQDELLTTVADIANLLRDEKIDDARRLHINSGQPLYDQIDKLVHQIVKIENDEMMKVRDTVSAAYRRAMLLIGVFAGIAIILALVLGFVISWSVILPVREADAFLSQVAKGDFNATINIPNRDEFGALAAQMNQMSRDLGRLSEEQEQAAQQLRSLNRQLEQASKAKSDFLANMSHELRTPLNAVIGFSEALNERVFGELTDKQAEYVGHIHSSGHHLLSLINDILDLSKIEAGRMELDLGRFELATVLDAALTLVKERAHRREVVLEGEISPDLGSMVGDARKFKQILLNLLSNAIKFTNENGTVRLSAESRDGKVVVTVSDTGVGMAESDLEVIFDEFRQLSGSLDRVTEGTGLGLSLTRRFVEMHGGEIRVTSEVGKGSVFTFWLPDEPVDGAWDKGPAGASPGGA
jgi:signal transduction histidine kinase